MPDGLMIGGPYHGRRRAWDGEVMDLPEMHEEVPGPGSETIHVRRPACVYVWTDLGVAGCVWLHRGTNRRWAVAHLVRDLGHTE